MATKKEIMRQLLKGVSWNEAARSLVPSRFLRTFGQPYMPASRCASSSSVTSR